MRFADYLHNNEISIPQAAKALEATVEAVRYWAKDQNVPRQDKMEKIFEWTKGQVQPNDFYKLPYNKFAAAGSGRSCRAMAGPDQGGGALVGSVPGQLDFFGGVAA